MRTPEQLLTSSETTARLLPHARLLSRLNRMLGETLPASLTRHTWVANFRQQTVIICTNNAAIATKLRQFNERLLTAFSKTIRECRQIEVKVQPVNAHPPPPLQIFPEGKPTISPRTAKKLLAAAKDMPEDSPLAASLRSIGERHLTS